MRKNACQDRGSQLKEVVGKSEARVNKRRFGTIFDPQQPYETRPQQKGGLTMRPKHQPNPGKVKLQVVARPPIRSQLGGPIFKRTQCIAVFCCPFQMTSTRPSCLTCSLSICPC